MEVQNNNKEPENRRKPNWLRVKLPIGREYSEIRSLADKHKLHTVCESANCPNMGECWGNGSATFMILGNICTRSCAFCAVATGKPGSVDNDEPERVAESIAIMKVKHCVITSVDRDDLKDGGALIWAKTIKAIRKASPGITIETLIPDFKGNRENLEIVLGEKPDIVSHNLETVNRLTKEIRPQAKYRRSLDCLHHINLSGLRTKSGLMLGLGETKEEVIEAMEDLLNAGVHIITLGQYLQPTKSHHPVMRYVSPEEFEHYKDIGLEKGFRIVESSPLVRSSYRADKHVFVW